MVGKPASKSASAMLMRNSPGTEERSRGLLISTIRRAPLLTTITTARVGSATCFGENSVDEAIVFLQQKLSL